MSLVGPRPRTVTVVSICLFIAAAVAFIVGASLLFPNRVMDWLWKLNKPAEAVLRPTGRLSALALLALGVGTFAAGKGLLQGSRWAWWFAVVLFVVNGIGDVVSFIVTGDWLKSASGVVVALGFLWALSRADVRRYVRL